MLCHQFPCSLHVRSPPAIACTTLLAGPQLHTCRSVQRAALNLHTLKSCKRLQSRPPLPCRLPSKRHHKRAALTVAYSSNNSPDVPDRVVASIPYLIPLIDGLRYGRFFFAQFPQFARLLAPLNPIVSLYFGVPFASFAVFFAVYLGIINNQNFSRYCRFNAMQAVLLDIVLILPGLFENLFRPPTSGIGLQIYINIYNSIWLFVFACVAYGVGSCLTGQTPRLPFVADAADQQIR